MQNIKINIIIQNTVQNKYKSASFSYEARNLRRGNCF